MNTSTSSSADSEVIPMIVYHCKCGAEHQKWLDTSKYRRVKCDCGQEFTFSLVAELSEPGPSPDFASAGGTPVGSIPMDQRRPGAELDALDVEELYSRKAYRLWLFVNRRSHSPESYRRYMKWRGPDLQWRLRRLHEVFFGPRESSYPWWPG